MSGHLTGWWSWLCRSAALYVSPVYLSPSSPHTLFLEAPAYVPVQGSFRMGAGSALLTTLLRTGSSVGVADAHTI